MADAESLALYLGVPGRTELVPLVEAAWDEAVETIDQVVESAHRVKDTAGDPREIPEAILDRCYLEVGANLYRRRDEQAGTSSQLAVLEGQTQVRAPRDPLASVRPILGRYLVWL